MARPDEILQPQRFDGLTRSGAEPNESLTEGGEDLMRPGFRIALGVSSLDLWPLREGIVRPGGGKGGEGTRKESFA